MLLRGFARAATVAVSIGVLITVATGQDSGSAGSRGSGGREVVFAVIDTEGLAGAPRYATVPAMMGERLPEEEERSQNLVLVPLPAPLWAAATGLTGLALVFAWRRHRLRSE